ncbi:MAG: efflux RND transporter periplasmic adaptor subunit [Acidobacteria bacterium]|nr:efflux RND transporter periplasmic adaptor subunit [Acidobacteriota bacterium]
MKRENRTMRLCWIGAALLALCACGGRESSTATAPAATTPPRDAPPAGVLVAPAMQQRWGVTVGPPSRGTSAVAITLPGVLRLNEQRTVQITSLLEGQVVSIGADLGDPVRRNQVLIRIHAPALAQARTAFLQAAARSELASREYDRGRMLLQQEAIDQKELLRRKAESDNANTEFGVAESHLHSFGLDQAAVDALLRRARQPGEGNRHDELADPYLDVVSPIDGRVVARDVIVGQHVEPERTLFTVTDLATLWAVLDAREADLPYLSAERAVRIRTSVYAGRTWPGRILHVGDIVDEQSRTVKVRVDTPNPGLLLKPNMFVQGEVADAVSTREVLTVPVEAVQTINGESVVFVRLGADRFVPRPVELGDRTGDRRTVVRGLDELDVIALTGAFNLKAELLKSSLAGQ